MDEAQNLLLSDRITEGMDCLSVGMKNLKNHHTANEWQEFAQTTFLEHPVTQIIHQCPFTYRSFSKPRGYAGDAELIDLIYGFNLDSLDLSNRANQIFEHCRYSPTSTSVRARLDVLAQTIDRVAEQTNHPVRMMSIACGHLREAQKSVAIQENNISKFIAFDRDTLSLQLIDSQLNNNCIETIQGSVTTLIREKQTFENLDLVYAAGLYDYLDQPFATRLTKIMFEMLRSGGKLLLANFVPNHPDIGYMETFMQWYLIYRTESQLEDVAKEIPTNEIAEKRTFFEENGNIVFLELTKV